jgi:hypothetical protein
LGIEVSLTSYGKPGRRVRVSGLLTQVTRGLGVVTDPSELWLLERDEVDPDLLGQRVTVEGELHGIDRIRVDWIGGAAN